MSTTRFANQALSASKKQAVKTERQSGELSELAGDQGTDEENVREMDFLSEEGVHASCDRGRKCVPPEYCHLAGPYECGPYE